MRNKFLFALHPSLWQTFDHFRRHAPLRPGILLLLLPSAPLAQELGERVQRFTLKNGLRLLMLERHLSPTVSIYIRYRAGAADEADGKMGAELIAFQNG